VDYLDEGKSMQKDVVNKWIGPKGYEKYATHFITETQVWNSPLLFGFLFSYTSVSAL
jgi:hypothetical protein